MDGESVTGTADIDKLPPSLKENLEELKREGSEEAGEGTIFPVPKKRGRKPGQKNKPKEPNVPEMPDFPIESLSLLHSEIWGVICVKMKSEFKLSPKGAEEMGTWSNQILKQYLGSYLAQHMALACYMLTQLTALSLCIAMRKPKLEISGDGDGV